MFFPVFPHTPTQSSLVSGVGEQGEEYLVEQGDLLAGISGKRNRPDCFLSSFFRGGVSEPPPAPTTQGRAGLRSCCLLLSRR